MNAVVAKLDDRPGAAPAPLLKPVGHDAGQHGRRGERPALRHVVPADGDRRSATAPPRCRTRRSRRRCVRALEGVVARGKAELGDKTMVDALAPAVDALDAALAPAGPSSARRCAPATAAAEARARRHHPDGRPQGPGQLPRRTQRRPPGPGRDVSTALLVDARRARPCRRTRQHDPDDGRDRRRLAQPGAGTAAVELAEEMLHGRRRAASTSPRASTTTTLGTDAVAIADAIARRDGGRGRRRPHGPGQRGALRRARPGPARRPAARAGDPLPGPARRGAVRRGGRRGHRGRPRRGRDGGVCARSAASRTTSPFRAAAPGPDAGTVTAATASWAEAFEVTWPHGLHARPAAVLVQARARVRRGRAAARTVTVGRRRGPGREPDPGGHDGARSRGTRWR